MSPETSPNPRQFRLRIWMTMVAVPVVALALVFWSGIDPFRRDPYSVALEYAVDWCAIQKEIFVAKGHFDWSKPKAEFISDEATNPTLPCLVKICYIPKIHDKGCDVTSFSLSQDGRMKFQRDIYSWAVQGGEGMQSPAETANCKKLVAALPASQWWISEGDAVAVGFLEPGGIWTTRLYDKTNLPPEVAALGAAMKIDFR